MGTQSPASTSRVRQWLCHITEGYAATAARLTPDQMVENSNLAAITFMAVQHHGSLKGNVFRTFLSSCHAVNSKSARRKEAPLHDGRTYETTIRPPRVIVRGAWVNRVGASPGIGMRLLDGTWRRRIQLSLQDNGTTVPPRAQWPHRSAGCRPITVRSAIQARVGPMCLHGMGVSSLANCDALRFSIIYAWFVCQCQQRLNDPGTIRTCNSRSRTSMP